LNILQASGSLTPSAPFIIMWLIPGSEIQEAAVYPFQSGIDR